MQTNTYNTSIADQRIQQSFRDCISTRNTLRKVDRSYTTEWKKSKEFVDYHRSIGDLQYGNKYCTEQNINYYKQINYQKLYLKLPQYLC